LNSQRSACLQYWNQKHTLPSQLGLPPKEHTDKGWAVLEKASLLTSSLLRKVRERERERETGREGEGRREEGRRGGGGGGGEGRGGKERGRGRGRGGKERGRGRGGKERGRGGERREGEGEVLNITLTWNLWCWAVQDTAAPDASDGCSEDIASANRFNPHYKAGGANSP
jgi:hypothetical protein